MAFDFSKVLSRTNGTKRRGNTVMLLEFLKKNRGQTIGNHVIQTNAVTYLNNMYGKTVSPDTLSRLWRSLREEYSDDKNNSTLHRNGISVVETKVNGSVQKHYQIGFSDGNGRY
jgi:hypothetical protein|tara:strand:- start:2870 stop:3211 length:342 start_codon:yes stop_codon:yes gene_type:complete